MALTVDNDVLSLNPDQPNYVIRAEGQQITVGDLSDILLKLPRDMPISLSVGPEYDDIPMTDAVVWPKYGAIFLVGDGPVDDDADDPDDVVAAIDTEFTPVATPEDDIHSAAEPA